MGSQTPDTKCRTKCGQSGRSCQEETEGEGRSSSPHPSLRASQLRRGVLLCSVTFPSARPHMGPEAAELSDHGPRNLNPPAKNPSVLSLLGCFSHKFVAAMKSQLTSRKISESGERWQAARMLTGSGSIRRDPGGTRSS